MIDRSLVVAGLVLAGIGSLVVYLMPNTGGLTLDVLLKSVALVLWFVSGLIPAMMRLLNRCLKPLAVILLGLIVILLGGSLHWAIEELQFAISVDWAGTKSPFSMVMTTVGLYFAVVLLVVVGCTVIFGGIWLLAIGWRGLRRRLFPPAPEPEPLRLDPETLARLRARRWVGETKPPGT